MRIDQGRGMDPAHKSFISREYDEHKDFLQKVQYINIKICTKISQD